MYESESSVLINDNLKSVFETAEKYPEFVNFYKTKSILYQDDKRLLIEIDHYIFGIPFRWKGEGIKNRYNEIRFRQVEGLLEGLEAHWSFRKESGKTKVAIKTNFSINNPILKILERPIGNLIIKRIIDKILINLRDTVEVKNKSSWE